MVRRLTPLRRGSLYTIVLFTSAIVAVMGVGGAYVRQRMLASSSTGDDLTHARAAARAALDRGLALADDGRGGFALAGALLQKSAVSLGSSSACTYLIDAATGAVVTSTARPTTTAVTLVGEGLRGDARSRLAIDATLGALDDIHTRVVDQGPVRYFPLNDAAGSSVMVESIGNADGFYTSSATAGRTTGPEGGPAPLFASVTESGGALSDATLTLASGTITFWLNPAAASGSRLAFAKGQATGTTDAGDLLIAVADGYLEVTHVAASSTGVLRSSSRLAADTWVLVAYSFGSSGQSLSIECVTAAQNKSFKNGLVHGSGDVLRVGGSAGVSYLGVASPLAGSIYGLAFFNRVLLKTEIEQIAGSTPAPSTSISFDRASIRWLVE